MFFTRGWKNGGNVPGAVDNLSASALSVALCRFLVRNLSYIPADTEIRFISLAGTVGISAIGMFGKGHSGWGMYPPTRSLELLVGSTAWKPAVVEGRIAPRQILNLTVLFDHAVIDGALAARFTRRLVELIESGYGLGEDLTMIATHTEPAAVWAAQVVA